MFFLGTWGDAAGFKYEWKVKGECMLIHYLKNYFVFNKLSVKPGLWHENWHFGRMAVYSYKWVTIRLHVGHEWVTIMPQVGNELVTSISQVCHKYVTGVSQLSNNTTTNE